MASAFWHSSGSRSETSHTDNPDGCLHVLGQAGWSTRHGCAWRMRPGQAGPGQRLSVPGSHETLTQSSSHPASTGDERSSLNRLSPSGLAIYCSSDCCSWYVLTAQPAHEKQENSRPSSGAKQAATLFF